MTNFSLFSSIPLSHFSFGDLNYLSLWTLWRIFLGNIFSGSLFNFHTPSPTGNIHRRNIPPFLGNLRFTPKRAFLSPLLFIGEGKIKNKKRVPFSLPPKPPHFFLPIFDLFSFFRLSFSSQFPIGTPNFKSKDRKKSKIMGKEERKEER
ncbi:MAG: hypothetical protein C6I01_02150 [Epsilonproteobacteria bacterium]|nr:hypothetical protein [Campylobacterota bacterium]